MMGKQDIIEVRKGAEKVRIAFFVESYPHASYTWLKDDKELMPDNPLYKFRLNVPNDTDMRVLRLIDIKEEHAGNYTLVGRQFDMVVKKSVQVIVFGKLKVF